jgi:hypothetical protein
MIEVDRAMIEDYHIDLIQMMENAGRNLAHLTCPFCGFREELEIPADYCLISHRCTNCNMQIKPAPGDCCVFCSYGDVLCIPKQQESLYVEQVSPGDFAAD